MDSFAVFDFDGTLIRWQLYHSLFDKLKKHIAIDDSSLKRVRDARNAWKIREHEQSYKHYETVIVEEFEKALPKISYELFNKIAEEVYEEHKNQVYTYTRSLIGSLKEQGYKLFAISGSHNEIVSKVARHWGFDDWVASEYKFKNDKYTGQKKLGFINKNESVKSLAEKHKLSFANSYGVGDSKSDIKMLEIVENPIAFNPSKELFEYAKRNGWKIVVERKNVIYALSDKNKIYTLN